MSINPFGGKKIALTGFTYTGIKVAGIDYTEIVTGPVKKLIKKVKGKYQKDFSDKVDFLVYASDDDSDAPEMVRAKELVSMGKNIQIISYHDFVEDAFRFIMDSWPIEETMIRKEAFSDISELENVIIPENITAIGKDAFSRCSKLKTIVLPKGLKVIGEDAFYGCPVENLDIPEGMEEIGWDAFNNGNNLQSVTIPSTVKIMGGNNFNGTRDIKVFDAMKANAGNLGGSFSEFAYTITVLSKETGEVKYVVPMFSQVNKDLEKVLYDAWYKDRAEFDFEKLDAHFSKVKKSEGKATIAEYRLKYPVNLSDERRKTYESYLKRTAKKRETEKPKDPAFEVKGSKLVKYKGDDPIVIVPEGITEIGPIAFGGNENIKEIIIPEGVVLMETNTSSESNAFKYCINLEKISLPDSLTNMPYGALDNIKDEGKLQYNSYDNGLYLGNTKNPYVCLVKTLSKDITTLDVPDGCRIICTYAVDGCLNLENITLPDSVVKIEDEGFRSRNEPRKNVYLRRNLKMNMPKDYLKRIEKLPSTLTYDLVTTKWRDEAVIEDYAWMYLYQGSKSLDELCERKMISEANRAAVEMDQALKQYPKKASFKKAAEFVSKNKDQIDKSVAHSLCTGAVAAKANDAADLLSFAAEEDGIAETPTIVAEDEHVNTEGTKLIISDGVSVIPKGFLDKYCTGKIKEIVLPDSVKLIDESKLPKDIKINMTDGYALTKEKLPPKFTCDLMSRPWYKTMKLRDYAYLYIYQSGSNFKDMCSFELMWDPDASVKELITALNDGGKSSHYLKVAEFIEENQGYISKETTNVFIDAAKSAKAKKAVNLVEPTLGKRKKSIPIKRKEIEVFCHDNYSEYANRWFLRDRSVYSLNTVKYKDTGKTAPDFVVYCTLVPYIELFKSAKDGLRLELLSKPDIVAAELEQESFSEALADIAEYTYWSHPQSIIPTCRFADEETTRRIVSQIHRAEWSNSKDYKRGAAVAKEALLLNDTGAAREFAQSIGRIKAYEKIHKK